MAPDTTRWVALGPQNLLRLSWPGEDEHLVFVERTGDLYLLAPDAAAILDRLSAGACTVEQLAVGERSPAATDAVVRTLAELGLIGPADA